MQWLLDHVLVPVLQWVMSFVSWVVLEILTLLYNGLVAVLNAIPVCGCFNTASNAFSSVPSGVAFFTSGFQFANGLQIILCCLLLRFLIRRIPFIG